MNYVKAIGYGIALFAIMFLIGSVVMFGLGWQMGGTKASLVMLAASIVVLYLLAGQYKVRGLNDGLQVGVVWLIVDILLEYLIIVQIFNKGVTGTFYTWSVLTGYALVVLVPAWVGAQAKK